MTKETVINVIITDQTTDNGISIVMEKLIIISEKGNSNKTLKKDHENVSWVYIKIRGNKVDCAFIES